ncbi:MAG: phage tail tape measure protein [Candidatus Accumulibacter sp.]|jgi:TP901 family phage tail tape measure protein|nr:phage tail tape measure protein [Accumulibacter sp.]
MASNLALTIGISADAGGALSVFGNLKGALRQVAIVSKDLKEKQTALGLAIKNSTAHPMGNELRKLNAQYEKQAQIIERLRKSTQALGQTRARIAANEANRTALRGKVMETAAIAYMVAQPIKVGIEFEAAMSKVQALTRLDKDSEEMKALAKQARELGASTSFTASEAAQAQGFLAMAGFKTEGIIKTMPHMLDLAKAGDMDLQRTADIASNIQTAFKVDDMQRVADVLTMTFTTSNTNLEQLSEAMKYAAPAARGLNVSLEETAAMTGLLGNVGIQASMAGTTLRNTFLNLSSPTSKAGKALKRLGVQTKDAKGNLKNMPELLYQVAQAMEKQKLGTGERAGIISTIFGTRATPGMIEMLTQAGGEGLKKYIQIVEDSKGAAAATHKIMADNLQGDLKALTSAWEELSISFVEGENSSLRDLVQTITGFLRGAALWVKENRELVSTGLKVAAMLVSMKAGALVLSYGFSMLKTPVFKIIGLFQKFSAMRLLFQVGGMKAVFPMLFKIGQVLLWLGRILLANPIGIALGLLALAGYMLYSNWSDIVGGAKALWSDFGDFFSGLWGQVKTAFDGGIAGISALILNWSPLGIFYSAFAAVLRWLGVDLPGKFTEFGSMIMQGLINGIKNSVTGVRDSMSMAIGDAVDSAKELLGINSPSRVFAQIGGFTMEGLEKGLSSATAGPLAVVKNLAGTLAAAGSIALAGSLPAMASLSLATPAGAGGVSGGVASATITVNVYPSPGMDEKALAELVAQKVEESQRRAAASRRSLLTDSD